VSNTNDPRKDERYRKTIEVMEPEIRRLKDLMAFKDEQVKWFCETVKTLVKAQYISESLVWYLVRLLDLYKLLDDLKNMKACLNNDFSFYKRFVYRAQMPDCIHSINRSIDTKCALSQSLSISNSPSISSCRALQGTMKVVPGDPSTMENQLLGMFLATQNSITSSIKVDLHKIVGFDEVIALIANQCALWAESDIHILPSEKYCVLRVMPYCLFLLDGDASSPHNVFKSKRININRFARLFKKTPVIPLYGDMQITLEAWILISPHFDEKAWVSTEATPADTKVARVRSPFECRCRAAFTHESSRSLTHESSRSLSLSLANRNMNCCITCRRSAKSTPSTLQSSARPWTRFACNVANRCRSRSPRRCRTSCCTACDCWARGRAEYACRAPGSTRIPTWRCSPRRARASATTSASSATTTPSPSTLHSPRCWEPSRVSWLACSTPRACCRPSWLVVCMMRYVTLPKLPSSIIYRPRHVLTRSLALSLSWL